MSAFYPRRSVVLDDPEGLDARFVAIEEWLSQIGDLPDLASQAQSAGMNDPTQVILPATFDTFDSLSDVEVGGAAAGTVPVFDGTNWLAQNWTSANFGIATAAAPTARLEIGAGSATAGTAPLKLNSGTVLTVPETGVFDYDGTLFFTPAAARRTVLLDTFTEGLNVTLGTATGTQWGTAANQKQSWWGATPVARPSAYTQTYSTADKTLGAYTSDSESGAYTGIDNAQVGTVYATVADLNQLRVAYETLRVFAEDAVAMLNSVVDDLQTVGLVG